MRDMKRLSFHAKGNRSGNLLHVETDGCVVNIHVGLTDEQGRAVTRVDVLADNEGRGGDGEGRFWHVDGPRVVRQDEDAEDNEPNFGNDGFISYEPRGVYVTLAGKPVKWVGVSGAISDDHFTTYDAALRALATAMVDGGVDVPAWCQGEHGPVTRNLDKEILPLIREIEDARALAADLGQPVTP